MASEHEVLNRSISRGLKILQVINRHRTACMADISMESGIPYPTARRIVRTLMDEGMVEQEPGRKQYRPTALVGSLSMGYQLEDWLTASALPILVETTDEIKWPVYICSRVGMQMVVKLSTDAYTALTFTRCYPGYTTPLLQASSGKAYLAFSDERERRMILDSVLEDETDPTARREQRGLIEAELSLTRDRGYAVSQYLSYVEEPGRSSGISLPILDGTGRVVVTLSMIFFASALSADNAVQKYLPHLRRAVARMEAVAQSRDIRGGAST